MRNEFLASLWKYFRGHGILNHTPCMCYGTSISGVLKLAKNSNAKEKLVTPMMFFCCFGREIRGDSRPRSRDSWTVKTVLNDREELFSLLTMP